MKALSLIPIAGLLTIFCLPSVQAWPGQHADSATVTGCLMQGTQANQYQIAAHGIVYDLYPTEKVNLAEYVGHEVRVKGSYVNPAPGGANTASRTAEENVNVRKLTDLSSICR